ncbi:hypothetical protein [Galbibacter sp. PAP.153]|uniref:hypothetical protein n=1 Tax=Galbibacter sp. PAP.153 TaxID=3104623 RepID=UPI003008DDF8
MNFTFEFLEPYISYILLGSFILLVLYIRSFIVESGKISALKRRNKELIEETESIKKEHQLDISKRKYQYESKKEQYLNFYKIIDSFTTEANKKMKDQLIPILDKFYKDYLDAVERGNNREQNNAVTVMSKKMQQISFDSYEELMRLRQETNTIRVIASDEIIKKLDLLEVAYEDLMKRSDKMMTTLPALITVNDQKKMKELQKDIEISGRVVKSINEQIINLMRKELNEI